MANKENLGPGKPVDGEAPDKDYLKKLAKKIRIHNKKYPTAPLVTPGGASNVYGDPINGAFFNRAMGHKVSQNELTPSTTGLADSSADAGEASADAGVGAGDAGAGDAGVVGGDVGGGMGESLRDTFEMLDLAEGVKVGDYMSEREYQDFLEREIKISKEHLNDPSTSAFLKDFYEKHIEECESALKKLKLDEKLELNATDSAKSNLTEIVNYINPKDWSSILKVLKKYSKYDNELSVFAQIKDDFKITPDEQYKIKEVIDDLQNETLSNTIMLADLSHLSTAIKYFVENNLANHQDAMKQIVEILEQSLIESDGVKELALAYIESLSEDDAKKCLDEILKISALSDIELIEEGPEEEVLAEAYDDSDDDLEFSAFITNLGKYNEGELVGEWVKFPIDEDDFEKELERIGIGSTDDFGQPYEEWFVTDYDTNTGISLGEYVSYEELNAIGELVEELNKYHNAKAFRNAIDAIGDDDPEGIAEAINDGDIIFYDDISNESDLGYRIIDEIYGDEIPKDLIEQYFDFEALGRDLRLGYYAQDDDDPETAGEYWCGDEDASDSDIGWAYYDAVGGEVANPENYFDYDAYGRDLTYGEFTLTKDGCIEDRR